MRTLKLTLSYDGTDFAGWQRQKGTRTVQAVLEQAFRQILNQSIRVVAAGRTDSGVHAIGQVVHAIIRSKMPLPILHKALNAVLPEDAVIASIRVAPQKFHAQYTAKTKWYRYTIWNQPMRPLFNRNYVLQVPVRLNVAAMRQAARLLQGRHDFKAFHSSGRLVRSTVRTLHSLTIRQSKGTLQIDAKADGFLYHMVRRIAGLLIQVGQGKVKPSSIQDLLHGKKNLIAPTSLAKGLCLMKVQY